MKRIKRFFVVVLLLVVVVYFLGPKPPKPELNKDLPSISASIGNIEKYVERQESGFSIKPDNEARILWADELKKERTDYCVLYLHGFSASWYEGYPTHVNFARHFGANLYIPRLHDHGLQTEEALLEMSPDKLWASAKEALMVARTLGKKVVLMGTSTGGTFALKLAADFPEYVHGLVLYSPNIRIHEKFDFLLAKPWGLQFARKRMDGRYRIVNDDFDSKICTYWNCKYRLEAVVYLQQLVEASMKKETFANVVAPVFLGYYYKDKENQDKTVKVDAMLSMYEQLGSLEQQKVKKAFPEAGAHVIACELTSGCVEELLDETIAFGEQILKMHPMK